MLSGLLGRKEDAAEDALVERAEPASAADILLRHIAVETEQLEFDLRSRHGDLRSYAFPAAGWPALPAATALARAMAQQPAALGALLNAQTREAAAGLRTKAEERNGSLASRIQNVEWEAAPRLAESAGSLAGEADSLADQFDTARAQVAESLVLLGAGAAPAAGAGLAPGASERLDSHITAPGIGGASAFLEAAVARMQASLRGLVSDLALLDEACRRLWEEVGRQVDLLGDVAHAVSVRGVQGVLPRCEALERMAGALDAYWQRLPPALCEEEGVAHYRRLLANRLPEIRARLADVRADLTGSIARVGSAGDIEERIAALERRCERLMSGEAGAEQAAPLIQQYVRPVVDDFIRGWLAPLLEEAQGEEPGHPLNQAAEGTLAILAETAGLQAIRPAPGDPLRPEQHEETEIRAGGPAGAVAELIRAGFSWEDEVIAKARVASWRQGGEAR